MLLIYFWTSAFKIKKQASKRNKTKKKGRLNLFMKKSSYRGFEQPGARQVLPWPLRLIENHLSLKASEQKKKRNKKKKRLLNLCMKKSSYRVYEQRWSKIENSGSIRYSANTHNAIIHQDRNTLRPKIASERQCANRLYNSWISSQEWVKGSPVFMK